MICHTQKKNVQSSPPNIDNVFIERMSEFDYLGQTGMNI